MTRYRAYAKIVVDFDSDEAEPDLRAHFRGAPPSFNNGIRDRLQNAWRAAATSYPGPVGRVAIVEWHYHVNQVTDDAGNEFGDLWMDDLPVDQPEP